MVKEPKKASMRGFTTRASSSGGGCRFRLFTVLFFVACVFVVSATVDTSCALGYELIPRKDSYGYDIKYEPMLEEQAASECHDLGKKCAGYVTVIDCGKDGCRPDKFGKGALVAGMAVSLKSKIKTPDELDYSHWQSICKKNFTPITPKPTDMPTPEPTDMPTPEPTDMPTTPSPTTEISCPEGFKTWKGWDFDRNDLGKCHRRSRTEVLYPNVTVCETDYCEGFTMYSGAPPVTPAMKDQVNNHGMKPGDVWCLKASTRNMVRRSDHIACEKEVFQQCNSDVDPIGMCLGKSECDIVETESRGHSIAKAENGCFSKAGGVGFKSEVIDAGVSLEKQECYEVGRERSGGGDVVRTTTLKENQVLCKVDIRERDSCTAKKHTVRILKSCTNGICSCKDVPKAYATSCKTECLVDFFGGLSAAPSLPLSYAILLITSMLASVVLVI